MNYRLKAFKAIFIMLFGFIFCVPNVWAQNAEKNALDKPIPQKAQDLLKNGVKLATEQDKVQKGLAQLKQAIVAAPHFVKAHSEYIRINAYWLDREIETRTEYEALMKKEPDNPVYPLALAQGVLFAPRKDKDLWFARAAALAPDWAWGHFAKSRSLEATDVEAASAEMLKAVEKEPAEVQFYTPAILLLIRQKKFDEAAALLEKLPASAEAVMRLNLLWDLQLGRANNSPEATAKLNAELEKLAATSVDVNTLKAIRLRYRRLKNEDKIKETEAKILRLDPNWYAEQGEISFTINFEEAPKRIFFAGRQNQINRKLKEIKSEIEMSEQVSEIEKLLALNPNQNNKKSIYQRLLSLATKTKDVPRAVKYGELLLADDPNDVATLASLAKVYAGQKKDLAKAAEYSLRAMDLTKEFRLVQRPADIDEKMFSALLPESRQRETYQVRRGAVLNSRAFTLAEAGKSDEAEKLLRESLALQPNEEAYSQLEKILRILGRGEEAEKTAAEGTNLWRTKIRAAFKNEPSKDFELTTIKGETVKLSALKGKIVMINYWATWCAPCIMEMPILIELYDKYKSKGLEILAISVDAPEDRPKISSFVEKTRMNFPVLYDENSAATYGVNSYPTTIFIDREGNLRYRASGVDIDNVRRNLELVILELMKNES